MKGKTHYTQSSLHSDRCYVGYCYCNGEPAEFPDVCTNRWNGVDCEECIAKAEQEENGEFKMFKVEVKNGYAKPKKT